MDINAIINRNGHFWPFYGPGYTNHLPMAQYALYLLGASEDQIKAFEVSYLKETDLQVVHTKLEVDHLQAHLGVREAYEAYVDFFMKEIDDKPISLVVSETLNALVFGLSSALFHGLIRINYAVVKNDHHEVARALASLACSFEPITFDGEIIVPDQLNEEITRYIKERKGMFYLRGNINEKIEATLQGLLALYLKTGSFIVLHTITGFEALLGLRVYFDDFTHVLDIFIVSVLRALLRIRSEDYRQIHLEREWTWDELVEATLNVKNAHTIKFVYSLKKLKTHYDLPELRTAASIKLKLDHQM